MQRHGLGSKQGTRLLFGGCSAGAIGAMNNLESVASTMPGNVQTWGFVDGAALLIAPCDILVPAAAGNQITADNAPHIQAQLVAEGANGPTSPAADAILAERGIPILPDVLTNAGGVTVSYFEWVQDLSRFFWDRDEIRNRLAEKLGDAFDRVWELAEERSTTLRDAALIAGIREVAAALEARGIYP